MRPPVSGGRSAGRGPASDRAMAINASRGSAPAGASCTGRGRTTSSIRTPSASTTTTAAGSPATNEYLPQRSERSTDSRIRPGPSPARAGKSPTGVETSARSSVQTGTMGQEFASASNSLRLGPHLQLRIHVRSFSSVPLGPALAPSGHGGGKQETPDRRPGAAGARGASAGPTSASTRGSASPRATSRSSRASASGADCACWAATSSTAETPVPLSCGTHAPVTDVRAHAPRGSGRRRHREPPPACSAAGSSDR